MQDFLCNYMVQKILCLRINKCVILMEKFSYVILTISYFLSMQVCYIHEYGRITLRRK